VGEAGWKVLEQMWWAQMLKAFESKSMISGKDSKVPNIEDF
jgi:hypothetical protein